MRLRAIRLHNVRRFTAPVEIAGIGPGLNVLVAPNESGKSTVFDALHALFFKDRKAWDRELRSLVPHAGGEPEVTVELDHAGQVFRVEKSWTRGRRGEARVFRDGHLLHQADDAEAWLAELVKAPRDGGPAGLLWVRQGLLGLTDGRETEAARRDLATSVAGEIEAMTGGRQMDTILRDCRADRDRYLTSRGPKKGGPLAEALERVAALEARAAELETTAGALRQDLDRRAQLARELAGLQDPAEADARRRRLTEAQAAHAAALRHAEDLDRAREVERTAGLALATRQAAIDRLAAELAEAAEAARQLAAADGTLTEAQGDRARQETALDAARDGHEAAKAAADRAGQILRQALKAEQGAQAADRRRELTGRLETARSHRRTVETLTATAQRGLDARALARIEDLAIDLAVARKARDNAAPAVTMRYAPGRSAGVSLQGAPLAEGVRMALPEGGQFEIEGIGSLQLHPGAASDGGAVGTARAALAAALAEHDLADLEAARQSAGARTAAEAALRDARAALALVAPDGIEALQRALAALPAPVETAADLPTAVEAEAREAAAAATLHRAGEVLEQARQRAEAARQADIRAATAREGAAARSERATLALAATETPERALADLRAALPGLDRALQEAGARRTALEAAAPDLAATAATVQRLSSAMQAAEVRIRQIETDLAGLEARIAMAAGTAVEEELAEAEGRLEAARAQAEAVRFELDVLDRLVAALENARQAARDRYVQPVLAELEPLIRMIWPGASLQVDADTLLPSGLTRSGPEEPFDVLSGGTQEQIALLVRLAFARILARSGTPAPVILDDAIVYTDDDRIEAIFDALTRQANDLQIIVLSCRQRAFRDLGGEALAICPARSGKGDGGA